MKESVTDFLNRGGEIKKLSYIEPLEEKVIIPIKAKPPEIIDLAEGSLIYSESILKPKIKKRVKRNKKISINESILPSSLKSLLKSVKNDEE